jgi:predicted ATP-grasp superfamily ATP-dependent carboligase
MIQKRKIVVLGTYRQSITVVRSLARAGFEVVVWREGDQKAYTEYSRYTRETWQWEENHGTRTEAGFLDTLIGYLIQEQHPPLIFPIGEDYLDRLARHAPRLTMHCTLVMPPPHTVFACLNKSRMYHLAGQLGIPLAATQTVSTEEQAMAAAASTGFPVLIKPIDSLRAFPAGKKAIICMIPEDLIKFFRARTGLPDAVILQKFKHGSRHNCEFSAKNGHLESYFESRVLRTDRLDGTGFGVEVVSVEPTLPLRRHCEALAKGLNYSGVGTAQFLVEQITGEMNFLELNPRLDANCALSYRCGQDFPRLALECTIGPFTNDTGQATSRDSYPLNKHVYWMFGDLQGCLQATRWKEVSRAAWLTWVLRALRALRRANYLTTWAWNDPLPMLAFLTLYVREIFRVKIRSIPQQEIHRLAVKHRPRPSSSMTRRQRCIRWPQ